MIVETTPAPITSLSSATSSRRSSNQPNPTSSFVRLVLSLLKGSRMQTRTTNRTTMAFRQTQPLANPPGSLTSEGCMVGCEMPLTSHTIISAKAPFQPA